MAKSVKENLKAGARAFGYLIVLAVLISAFSGDESDENGKNVAETAVTEQEVAASQTAETPAEVATPEPTPEVTPEEKKVTSLDEARVEDDYILQKSEEEDLEEEYQAKLREQEEEEEEEQSTPDDSGTSTSIASASDNAWATTAQSDMSVVQSDMEGLSKAATNEDVSSMKVYADRLYTSTQTAIDNSDEYTVSSDLSDVQEKYRSGMVSYHSAAMACYAGIEAYNSGDLSGAEDSFTTSADLLNAGTNYMNECNRLLNEYIEAHS